MPCIVASVVGSFLKMRLLRKKFPQCTRRAARIQSRCVFMPSGQTLPTGELVPGRRPLAPPGECGRAFATRRERGAPCRVADSMNVRNKHWSPSEDAKLCDAAAKGLSLLQTALRLRRSQSAVKHRASALGVKLKRPTRLPQAEQLLPIQK
jgi:hypothetical protein